MSYNFSVPILIDADALIKLHRAGVLERMSRAFDCIIPEMVYHEVITRGREFKHPDAEEIDKIIQSDIKVESPVGETPYIADVPGVDAGEKDLLALFSSFPAEEEIIIVSDDRRFLAVLGRLGIPALIPADFIVLMAQQGFLAQEEARNALEQMRPSIRETAYRQALDDLEE